MILFLSTLSSQGEGHAAAGLTFDSDPGTDSGPVGQAGPGYGHGVACIIDAHREGCLVPEVFEGLRRLHEGHL